MSWTKDDQYLGPDTAEIAVMEGLKALAVQAADWINATPPDVYPKWRCHRYDDASWYVIALADKRILSANDWLVTDAELVACAKAMGWVPEPAADPDLPVEFQGHDWEGWELTEDPKRGKWMWRDVAGETLRIYMSGELSILGEYKDAWEEEDRYLCRGPVAKSKHIADLIIEGMEATP